MTSPGTRQYRSTRRAQQAAQTRADIAAAATRLFCSEGWIGTTVAKVAREAGVAPETVYGAFGTKAALLRAAVDAAVVGDTSAGALRERDAFVAIGVGPPGERLARAAELLTGIIARTHLLFAALREASRSDAELAADLERFETNRRADAALIAALLAGHPVDDITVDGVWAVLGTEVYANLVTFRGWSTETYRTWVSEVLRRLLEPS